MGVAEAYSRTSPGSRVRRWRLLYVSAIMAVAVWMIGRDMTFMRTAFVYDVFIYQCYARAFWQGPQRAVVLAPETRSCRSFWGPAPQRFRAFPQEYPVLSLGVFSLPLLTPWLPYNAAFLWWMALCLLLATLILAWRGPPGHALALLLYTLLAGWQFVLARYDLVPGLGVLLALVLAQRGRMRAATVALAAGTLLKGFPVLLLPLLLINARRKEGRWRLDCLILFVGLLLVVLLPALVLNPHGILSPIRYALHRPLHIESLSGMLLWVTSGAGKEARVIFSFGSYNVVGAYQGLFATAFSVLFVAGLAGAYWRQGRGRDSLARSFMLVLIVTLVTNKVFSPQYILWLLPTAAFVEGICPRWLIVATLIFFVSGDGALPFSVAHLSSSTSSHPFPSPLFVLKILASDLYLCGLAIFYMVHRGDEQDTEIGLDAHRGPYVTAYAHARAATRVITARWTTR